MRMTRDGEVVVIHDATVNRTTDGRGRVAAVSAAAIKRLDARRAVRRGFRRRAYSNARGSCPGARRARRGTMRGTMRDGR